MVAFGYEFPPSLWTQPLDGSELVLIETGSPYATHIRLSSLFSAQFPGSFTPFAAIVSWPSAAGAVVVNGTYEVALSWLWSGGRVTGITADTSGGLFVVTVRINGVAVPGLSGLTVNSSSPVTTTAGANALVLRDNVTLLISGTTGVPTDSTVQVNFLRSYT